MSAGNEHESGKLSAAIDDSQRRARKAVEPGYFEYRNLRDDEFWRALPPFADVDRETFLSTKWQMQNSVYGMPKLLAFFEGWADPAFVADVEKGFHIAPMAVRVTPYLLSLINWDSPYDDPIRTQFIPLGSNFEEDHPMLTLDSLSEQVDAPVPGLTHRYADKALFLALDTCPVYCRFCTRSYAIGVDTDTVEKVSLKVNPKRWEQAFAYIESRPELEDIVISGGDAFNLPAKHLKAIGERLLNMKNIRRIRYATKGPAVMPMKLLSDPEWVEALTDVHAMGRRMHKQVAVHTHFNPANEITEITRQAINVLFEHGITVRNQSVLQTGVNNTVESMTKLVKRLGEINVHPYYVYQHDMVSGVESLRTNIATALEIELGVRGCTAGFNQPLVIVDAPGGGGKRSIFSFEHYNRETGISVYRAPAVKLGQNFLYFDPLHSLSAEVRARWQVAGEREEMIAAAIKAVGD